MFKNLTFDKFISPQEIAEAIKMRGNGELSPTGMKNLLFGLYKERLNRALKILITK